MEKIDVLRRQIDEIDDQVLELLGRRGEIAQKIGEEKTKSRLPNFHSPSRELKIFQRLFERNQGPYPDDAIRDIFREIFSATLSLEKPLRVAFLGPEATFTHLAGQKKFGKSAQFFPQKSITDIFSEVERSNVEYGIVPIENSVEGVVGHTLDLLVNSSLCIIAEISLEVSLHLLTSHGDMAKIKKVCSHPHGLAQCRGWLEKNLPHAALEHQESTAAAAQSAQKDETVAAVANEIAAEMYRLKITASKIQDLSHSVTRFVVISPQGVEKSGRDKTSLVFSVSDRPGSLLECLKILADKNINMTKIESRPAKKKAWEYIFFVDIDGHQEDEVVGEALGEIRKSCAFLKVLGSYPKDV